MQPIIEENGVRRFQANAVVEFLFSELRNANSWNLEQFPREDFLVFKQLVGCTIEEFIALPQAQGTEVLEEVLEQERAYLRRSVLASLVLRKSEYGDYYLIEEDDGSDVSDASVEGTSTEMRTIAEAIRQRKGVAFHRCAVFFSGDRVHFASPRNSRAILIDYSLAQAEDLATRIEKMFGV